MAESSAAFMKPFSDAVASNCEHVRRVTEEAFHH
jgi:hypothetical protein